MWGPRVFWFSSSWLLYHHYFHILVHSSFDMAIATVFLLCNLRNALKRNPIQWNLCKINHMVEEYTFTLLFNLSSNLYLACSFFTWFCLFFFYIPFSYVERPHAPFYIPTTNSAYCCIRTAYGFCVPYAVMLYFLVVGLLRTEFVYHVYAQAGHWDALLLDAVLSKTIFIVTHTLG